MEEAKLKSLPPPPGVINSLKAGFDAIAAHIGAIVYPLALDLFLWLGPRLSVQELYAQIMPQLTELWVYLGVPTDQLRQMQGDLAIQVVRLNLFWFLRTVPVGIPSLFASNGAFGKDLSKAPLNSLPLIHVTSLESLTGLIFLMGLVGWIGGALYFRAVSRVVSNNEQWKPVSVGRAITQTILLSILWGWIVTALGMPTVNFLKLLSMLNPILMNIAAILFGVLSLWVVVPLFFWPHGVFLYKQNVFASIISSLRLTRYTIPVSSMYVLTAFLMTIGLNFVWSVPPGDSWMTLVGILGHAFVSTSLVAAGFIYYRDLNVWLQAALDQMKRKESSVTSSQ